MTVPKVKNQTKKENLDTEADVLFTKPREVLKLFAKEVKKGVYKYWFLRE